jgi:hypothetical protein
MGEKIAFLFLTRGEHHNIKLWERFFESANEDLYKIAIHAKDPSTLKSSLWTDNKSLILRPIPTAWGTISLVNATIYLLQMVMVDPKITKFILLSEFCIPTTNFQNVYELLMKEKGKSRINWSFGNNLDRYNIIKNYLAFPASSWAKQSQWMCLDRNHVNSLFIPAYNGKFVQYLNAFRYCPAPDEHLFINYFLHVVRINQNEFINHPITFVDWSTNTKHPKLFTSLNKDIINHSRKNKILFARKFSPLQLTIPDQDYLLEVNNEPKEPKEPKEIKKLKELNEPENTKKLEETLTTEAQAILNYFTDGLLNKVKSLSPHIISLLHNSIFEVNNNKPLNSLETETNIESMTNEIKEELKTESNTKDSNTESIVEETNGESMLNELADDESIEEETNEESILEESKTDDAEKLKKKLRNKQKKKNKKLKKQNNNN